MISTVISEGVLERFPAMSLVELQTKAAFLTRCDRKYLVPADACQHLVVSVADGTRILEIDHRRAFTYITNYFDDDQFSAYLRSARRRPNRFKVRTRRYVESGRQMLEVKVRDGRGRTVKQRTPRDDAPLDTLTVTERAWLARFPEISGLADRLRHCVTTEYRRVTLVLPDGSGRVTLDQELSFVSPDGRRCAVPGLVTIETKSAGRATSVDRLLWRCGYRPTAISKFASGMSLLSPELPNNRWHRVCTRLRGAATITGPVGVVDFCAVASILQCD